MMRMFIMLCLIVFTKSAVIEVTAGGDVTEPTYMFSDVQGNSVATLTSNVSNGDITASGDLKTEAGSSMDNMATRLAAAEATIQNLQAVIHSLMAPPIGPPSPPGWPTISTIIDAARVTVGMGIPTSYVWDAGTSVPEVYDGLRSNTISATGNLNGRCVVIRLAQQCASVSVALYGYDHNSVPYNQLRHMVSAYSTNGNTWTCYTQSEGWFDTARTDCSVSSISPTSGVVLNFPSPAKYLMFGFAGNTHLWEVELRSCPAA
jgi:hypothetical protein